MRTTATNYALLLSPLALIAIVGCSAGRSAQKARPGDSILIVQPCPGMPGLSVAEGGGHSPAENRSRLTELTKRTESWRGGS